MTTGIRDPLTSPWWQKVPGPSVVKPTTGRCKVLGCFPDLMGPEPSLCIYCGELVEDA